MPSVTFIPGQVLTRSDLNLFLTNTDGQRQDAYSISYAIYDYTTGVEKLIGSATRTPEHPEVGEYYTSFRVPDFAAYGDYRIRWTFKQYAGGPDNQVVQEFGVVPEGTQTSTASVYSAAELALIKSLRYIIRDQNPDRNYRFAPPSSQSALNKQTRVFGYIWEDDELSEAIQRGLDMTNLYPPQTSFIIGNLPTNWRTIVLTGAAVHALTALTINWIAEEFDYSIGGVSLNLEKSSKYESLASSLQDRFQQMLEFAHQTVKISKGLQQPRMSPGVRSAFGPHLGGSAFTPRNFVRF